MRVYVLNKLRHFDDPVEFGSTGDGCQIESHPRFAEIHDRNGREQIAHPVSRHVDKRIIGVAACQHRSDQLRQRLVRLHQLRQRLWGIDDAAGESVSIGKMECAVELLQYPHSDYRAQPPQSAKAEERGYRYRDRHSATKKLMNFFR